jgi:hypothetical protein
MNVEILRELFDLAIQNNAPDAELLRLSQLLAYCKALQTLEANYDIRRTEVRA